MLETATQFLQPGSVDPEKIQDRRRASTVESLHLWCISVCACIYTMNIYEYYIIIYIIYINIYQHIRWFLASWFDGPCWLWPTGNYFKWSFLVLGSHGDFPSHVWYICIIYANIWGILMVNGTIHSIHGSYGVSYTIFGGFTAFTPLRGLVKSFKSP